MEKICVLMSTYNGELYLRQQIDSILTQNGVMVDLLVRDDGSTDKTIEILTEYKSKGLLNFYKGKNIGPAQSFMDLINNAPECKYYSFSDQDDVWDEDKLKVAIDFIRDIAKSKPVLYHSNLRVVDHQLKFYRNAHNCIEYDKNKYSALLINYGTGCTEVFNDELIRLVKNKKPEYIGMHDWWLYAIAKMFGVVVYDAVPHISYRQHGKNVIGLKLRTNNINYLINKVKRIYTNKEEIRRKFASSFFESYKNELSAEDVKVFSVIVNYKASVINKIKFVFSKHLKTKSTIRNIFLVGLVVLNRL